MNYNAPPTSQFHIEKRSTVKTIMNYQRTEVFEKLTTCLKTGAMTEANYWSAELFISGFLPALMDFLMDYYFKYLACLNPHLLVHLHKEFEYWNAIKKSYTSNTKQLCNSQELRNHLCQVVSVFCVCKRLSSRAVVNNDPSVVKNDSSETDRKAKEIIRLLVPTLGQDSVIYQKFSAFITNYYDNLLNCRHYVDWFVRDQSYTVAPFQDFKVPPTLAQRGVWLIWKFLLSNLKNQRELTPFLKISTDLFITIYKSKNFDICINLLWFIVQLARNPESINWDHDLDRSLQSSQILKHTIEINLIYQNLLNSYQKMLAKGVAPKIKPKKLTQKEQDKLKFYADPRKQDFLQAINNVDLLMNHTVSEVGAEVSPMGTNVPSRRDEINRDRQTNPVRDHRRDPMQDHRKDPIRNQRKETPRNTGKGRVDDEEIVIPIASRGQRNNI